MDCHDPDTVACRIHLPLDFHIIGLEPDQEAGQTVHRLLLIAHRLAQKGINALLRLWTQAREQAVAAPVARQDAFDEVIGPQEIGVVAQVAQDLDRVRKIRGAVVQLPPQVSRRPPLRQIIERRFGPTEKRRFQRDSQGIAVLRKGEKRQERGQIPHGNFRPDLEPVGPCNRQVERLALADDLVEQIAPALHKDEKITGLRGLRSVFAICRITRRDRMAAIDQAFDLRRDLPGKNHARIIG